MRSMYNLQWAWYSNCLLQVGAPKLQSKIDRVLGTKASQLFAVPDWTALSINSKWLKAVERTQLWTSQLKVST
jgi:hypothetical protein